MSASYNSPSSAADAPLDMSTELLQKILAQVTQWSQRYDANRFDHEFPRGQLSLVEDATTAIIAQLTTINDTLKEIGFSELEKVCQWLRSIPVANDLPFCKLQTYAQIIIGSKFDWRNQSPTGTADREIIKILCCDDTFQVLLLRSLEDLGLLEPVVNK